MMQRPFFAHFKAGPESQRGWVALGADYWHDALVILTAEHSAPGYPAVRDIRQAWTRLKALSPQRPPWPQLWVEWKANVLQQSGGQPIGLTLTALAPGPSPELWMAGYNSVPGVRWRDDDLWIPGVTDGMQVTSQPGDLWIWGTPNLWNATQHAEMVNIIQTSSSTEDIATRLIETAQEVHPHAFGALVAFVEA